MTYISYEERGHLGAPNDDLHWPYLEFNKQIVELGIAPPRLRVTELRFVLCRATQEWLKPRSHTILFGYGGQYCIGTVRFYW